MNRSQSRSLRLTACALTTFVLFGCGGGSGTTASVSTACTVSLADPLAVVPDPPPQPNNTKVVSAHAVKRRLRD